GVPRLENKQFALGPLTPITLPPTWKMACFINLEQFVEEEDRMSTAHVRFLHQCSKNIPLKAGNQNAVKALFGLEGNKRVGDQRPNESILMGMNDVIPFLIIAVVVIAHPAGKFILSVHLHLFPNGRFAE